MFLTYPPTCGIPLFKRERLTQLGGMGVVGDWKRCLVGIKTIKGGQPLGLSALLLIGTVGLEVVVLVGEVFCHVEEEGGNFVEVHVEVAAEANAVFEDGDIVPLQALESAMEIKSLQFFLVRFASHVGLQQ